MAAEEYYVRIDNDLVKFLTWPGLFCTYVMKILLLQESFDAKFWELTSFLFIFWYSIKFYNTEVTIVTYTYTMTPNSTGRFIDYSEIYTYVLYAAALSQGGLRQCWFCEFKTCKKSQNLVYWDCLVHEKC